jgi:hypothetical protein
MRSISVVPPAMKRMVAPCRAALAVIAAFLGAGEVDVLAQAIQQRRSRIEREIVGAAVDAQFHGNLPGGRWDGCRIRIGIGPGLGCARRADDAGGAELQKEASTGWREKGSAITSIDSIIGPGVGHGHFGITGRFRAWRV